MMGVAAGRYSCCVQQQPPDLVYVVRPGVNNEELRYSLRSVAVNVSNYRKIWVAGTILPWVRNVERLRLEPIPEKFRNIRQSLAAVVNDPRCADTVVVFNDDHFVTSPIDASDWPNYHLGPAADLVDNLIRDKKCSPRNTWLIAMKTTAEWVKLQGVDVPLSFESHTPVAFDTKRLAELLSEYPTDQRCAYPQLYQLAGAGHVVGNYGNSKVAGLGRVEFAKKAGQGMPFLSSNDKSFKNGVIGDYVRKMFPNPSRFEQQ